MEIYEVRIEHWGDRAVIRTNMDHLGTAESGHVDSGREGGLDIWVQKAALLPRAVDELHSGKTLVFLMFRAHGRQGMHLCRAVYMEEGQNDSLIFEGGVTVSLDEAFPTASSQQAPAPPMVLGGDLARRRGPKLLKKAKARIKVAKQAYRQARQEIVLDDIDDRSIEEILGIDVTEKKWTPANRGYLPRAQGVRAGNRPPRRPPPVEPALPPGAMDNLEAFKNLQRAKRR